MTQRIVPSITLNDGTELPAIGLGTYGLNGAAGVESIRAAIASGYRLLDSAFSYENEGAVGAAIRKTSVPREELRVTSKLPGRHHSFVKAIATIEESLYRAQLDYYDLYLIHWPNPHKGLYVEAWQALVEARKRGLIRSIGVSNFLAEHIEAIVKATNVAPVINQVELHPYFPQAEQRAVNERYGIVTQAWSPLGRANQVLQEPLIRTIADRLGRTIAQIILRWQVQLGAVPLPKAADYKRQIENISIFDFQLSAQDMASIAALGRLDGRTFDQDPAHYEEF